MTREAPELGAAVIRMLRALARRAGEGELEALEQLAMLQDSLQMQLGAAVAGYRDFQPAHNAPGYSWADVASILGCTKQSAWERFKDATVAPAWPASSCVCQRARCNPLACHHCAGHSDPELCPRWGIAELTNAWSS